MMALFGRLGAAFGRLGAGKTAAPAVSGSAGDSLLLFDSQGVTLLHLGLI